jgi:serine phosphatase RsbU (regulator of sigma subunit)
VFNQEQLQAAAHRHAAHPPEEFFTRVLQDIRQFSKRESFDDDVCVVGLQVQHID